MRLLSFFRIEVKKLTTQFIVSKSTTIVKKPQKIPQLPEPLIAFVQYFPLNSIKPESLAISMSSNLPPLCTIKQDRIKKVFSGSYYPNNRFIGSEEMMKNLTSSENKREKPTDLFSSESGLLDKNEMNSAESPMLDLSGIEEYLFTPRTRSEKRAEVFLEEWVRRFSRV